MTANSVARFYMFLVRAQTKEQPLPSMLFSGQRAEGFGAELTSQDASYSLQ